MFVLNFVLSAKSKVFGKHSILVCFFLFSTSLINGEIETKISENGLRKSDIQLQMQDTRMYLHVNQWHAEYNGFYRIVAFLKNEKCKDI